MAGSEIEFIKPRVALIVRGKSGLHHRPGLLEQHADCVLSNGEPVGFFGDGPVRSGGSMRSASGSSLRIGLNMSGQVVFYQGFYEMGSDDYVDINEARMVGIPATMAVLDVTLDQAEKFDHFWRNLSKNPGVFNLIGKNCSNQAANAFVHAGILKTGGGLRSTPNGLLHRLVDLPGLSSQVFVGFFGFSKMGSRWRVVFEGTESIGVSK